MTPHNSADKSTTNQQPRLLDKVPDKLRVKHYSIGTEQAYMNWIKRYIFFHDKRHPQEMDAQDIEFFFLTYLAVAGKVTAFTQNQAQKCVAVSLP